MVHGRDVVFVDEDDGTFLSLVEAAEADALSRKRKRIDGQDSQASISRKKEEGAYIAALKGSKSLQWQQQQSNDSTPLRSRLQGITKAGNLVIGGGAAGSGAPCFKCGKLGHWARDCDALGGGGRGGAERENHDPSVVEKPCPCGLGTCLVLTANTEKNRGRKFYKCPFREENGGCGFFEWCDNSSGTPIYNGAQIQPSNSSYPDLQCFCGAGSCSILTARTGKNVGQQFYRCPANQGNSCGFFKWCSEQTSAVGFPMSTSQVCSSFNDASSKNHNGRSSSTCFKCGQEGHWARDCPKPSSDYSAGAGGMSGSAGTCYKCNRPGHWARDCTGQDMKVHHVQ
ncbi:cold shock domain-containing protein 3-like [Macadamia integrifolia]|uniref:cold shock domain-containing protein 3-like n=1 Tax=Macadamia integrifolia TaxID=60698 RepID=UPI001C52F8E6|nr:cold shock domain-containing protein 3-like [Macadamia integrifolia]